MPRAEPVKLCPHCKSMRVHRSHRRNKLDRLLFLLGAEIRRCHDCRFRRAFCPWFAIPLGEPQATHQRRTHIVVMTSGFAVFLLVVLWMIRRFTDLSG